MGCSAVWTPSSRRVCQETPCCAEMHTGQLVAEDDIPGLVLNVCSNNKFHEDRERESTCKDGTMLTMGDPREKECRHTLH